MVLKKGKKSGFTYQRRTPEQLKKREQQSGTARDSYIKNEIKVWTPVEGRNRVRILPPTWGNPDHFGLDVWLHYQVGVDQSTYLCLQKNPEIHDSEECPVCEARARFQADASEEAADALTPRKRVLAYIIDRDKPNDGVVLWPMAYTVDRDLAAECHDEDTGEVYAIDDPEEGWDVIVRRTGQGQTTKYAVALGKQSTPLSQDDEQAEEWLEFITQNPIPDLLIVADREAMEKAIGSNPSGIPRRDRDQKEDKLKARGRRGAKDEEDEEEDERPIARKRARPVVDDEEDEEEALRGKVKSKRAVGEDEDEEEEAPRSGRSAKSTARSKPARDEVEDDDDEDNEEEAPPKSSRLASKTKPRRADPDDDEDEDDPPPRTRPKLGDAGVKSKLGALRGVRK